jgi:hypothetical protein
MDYFACDELESLARRLLCAVQRKNELRSANLNGKWMTAAEADLTRTHELIRDHRQTCSVCNGWCQEMSKVDHPTEDVYEEKYPPEDPDCPFRAPPRRFYRPRPALVLQFPSQDPHVRTG